MSEKTGLVAIFRPMPTSSLLDREVSSPSPLSENQNFVDQMVSSSLSEAAKGSTLLAMLGAGAVSRLTRAGVMSLALGEGTLLPLMARGGSYAIALANESATFAGIERGFHSVPSGTEFHPFQTSFEKDWARAFINLGSLKLLGTAAEGQNLLLQHLLTDLGMVGGQQVGAKFGLVEKPQGGFAQQMVQAEALNWSQKGGMALLHGLSPNLLSMEKSLDLYLRSRESDLFSKGQSLPFFSRLAVEGAGIFSAKDSEPWNTKGSNVMEMSGSKKKGRGSGRGRGLSNDALDNLVRQAHELSEMAREMSGRFQLHGSERDHLRFLGDNPHKADSIDVTYLGEKLLFLRTPIQDASVLDRKASFLGIPKAAMEDPRPVAFQEGWEIFYKILQVVNHTPVEERLAKKVHHYLAKICNLSDLDFLRLLEASLQGANTRGTDTFPLTNLLFEIHRGHPVPHIKAEAERIMENFLQTLGVDVSYMARLIESWGLDRFHEEVTAAAEKGDFSKVAQFIAALASVEKSKQVEFLSNSLLGNPYPIIRYTAYQFLEGALEGTSTNDWRILWENTERSLNEGDRKSLDPSRITFARSIVELMARHGIPEAQRLWAQSKEESGSGEEAPGRLLDEGTAFQRSLLTSAKGDGLDELARERIAKRLGKPRKN